MREVADRARIEAFLAALTREATTDTNVEPLLYRFPAIDPASFRLAVDAVFPP